MSDTTDYYPYLQTWIEIIEKIFKDPLIKSDSFNRFIAASFIHVELALNGFPLDRPEIIDSYILNILEQKFMGFYEKNIYEPLFKYDWYNMVLYDSSIHSFPEVGSYVLYNRRLKKISNIGLFKCELSEVI